MKSLGGFFFTGFIVLLPGNEVPGFCTSPKTPIPVSTFGKKPSIISGQVVLEFFSTNLRSLFTLGLSLVEAQPVPT
jgi:hypothetical protein